MKKILLLAVVLLAVAAIVLAAVFNKDEQAGESGGSTGTTASTEFDFNLEDIFGSGGIELPEDVLDDDDVTVPTSSTSGTSGTTASTQNKKEDFDDTMPEVADFKIFYASSLFTVDGGVINTEKKTTLLKAIESYGYLVFPEDMRADLSGVSSLSGYDLYIFEDMGLVDVTLDGGAAWYISSWTEDILMGNSTCSGSYVFAESNPEAYDRISLHIKNGVTFNELTTSSGKVSAQVTEYREVSANLEEYKVVYSTGDDPLIFAKDTGARKTVVVTFSIEDSNLNMYMANFNLLIGNFISFSK